MRTAKDPQRPKQIVFVKELTESIRRGSICVTYRKTKKSGTYVVMENRFKKISANLLIEFYRSEKVDPYQITDNDAKLAGIADALTIKKLFEKWYGVPIPSLYRNWFRLV
jgi:uncharacterized protein YcgL (UPF0745 family)